MPARSVTRPGIPDQQGNQSQWRPSPADRTQRRGRGGCQPAPELQAPPAADSPAADRSRAGKPCKPERRPAHLHNPDSLRKREPGIPQRKAADNAGLNLLSPILNDPERLHFDRYNELQIHGTGQPACAAADHPEWADTLWQHCGWQQSATER